MSFDVQSLGALCQIKQGKYLSPGDMSEKPTAEKSIPVIGGNGILGYTDKASHTTDVALITCRGSKCGLIQWVEAPVWVSNNAMACDTGNLLGNKFLRYLFGSTNFSDVVTGSAQPQITIRHLSKKEFSICPKDAWAGIVGLLGSLDDRITLLRETNATLEAIAQALFKSWFVDFDPVRAKAEGRARQDGERSGQPRMPQASDLPRPGAEAGAEAQGQPEYMDAATAALFPDSFEESELGLVPRGWRVVSVSDVAEVVKGKSYTSKELASEHHTALVTLKSFERGGGFRLDGFKPYTGNYKSNQVVYPGDLIVAYTDVTQAAELIGKPAIVVGVEEYKTLVASLDVGIVRPDKGKVSRQYLYGLFRTENFQSHTFAHTSGTTVLHLAKDGVGSYRFVCPSREVMQSFSLIAEALSGRRQSNIDQMRTLTQLRDTLLPRLISGQLRLPEAEATVEEVL